MYNNIMSPFGFKKFNIVCRNDNEWFNTQKELFKLGFYWETNGKNIITTTWKYPVVLQNYRSDYFFGSKILIYDDFKYLLHENKEYINANSFIRKRKLNKIKLK